MTTLIPPVPPAGRAGPRLLEGHTCVGLPSQCRPQMGEDSTQLVGRHSQPPLSNYALERSTPEESISARHMIFKEHNKMVMYVTIWFTKCFHVLCFLAFLGSPWIQYFHSKFTEEDMDV